MNLENFCWNNFSKYPSHSKWHHSFLQAYDVLWAFRKDEPLTILEIGVHTGASSKLFHDYFPNSKIIGIEHAQCHIDSINLQDFPRLELFCFNGYDERSWEGFPYNKFDIVIDDAVALPQDFDNPVDNYNIQLFTLNHFHNRLNPGGLIIINCIQHRNYENRIRQTFKGDQSKLVFYDLRNIKDYYDNMMMVYFEKGDPKVTFQ